MARNLTIELSKSDVIAVNRWLDKMDKVDQSNTVQSALREGAKIIMDAGKANLATRNKTKTGNLKGSFRMKVVKKKAYALSCFKRPGGNHSYLIDRGTDKRYTKKGYYRGSVSKGSPNKGSMFWTDAVQANGGKAVDRLMSAIYEALTKINNR
jgi:hypothetical protein